MTAKEFAIACVEDSGYQLNACLKDMSEENFDAKPVPTMMSARESVGHLLEVFVAIQAEIAGVKYAWGTFEAPEIPAAELIELFNQEREVAIQAALDAFEEKPNLMRDFLIGHEFYHVGQLAAIRIALADGWNPYSIYNH